MPESLIPKNMRDGTLRIYSGADSYTVKYEQGNLNLNIPGPSVSVYMDRGRFADAVHGTPALRYNQDQPMTGSFAAHMRDMPDASYVTLADFMARVGAFTSWTSTLGSSAEVPTVNLEWTIAGAIHGDAADKTVLLQYCWMTGAIAEGDPNTITMNFTSYDLLPTVT